MTPTVTLRLKPVAMFRLTEFRNHTDGGGLTVCHKNTYLYISYMKMSKVAPG